MTERRTSRVIGVLVLALLSLPAPAAAGAASDPTGDVIALGDGGNALRLVDPDDGTRRDLPVEGPVFATDLAPDERSLALAYNGRAEVHDLDTGGVWRPYEGGRVRNVRWSPSDERLPLLLTAESTVLGEATRQWLSRARGSVLRVDVLGDRSVIHDSVASDARSAATP